MHITPISVILNEIKFNIELKKVFKFEDHMLCRQQPLLH